MSAFSYLGTACRAFGGYEGVWFFCGGVALDLYLGAPIRTRHDIDIGILRDEQDLLPKQFPGIKISYVTPGSPLKSPWREDRLELPVHELYVHIPGEPLEVL